MKFKVMLDENAKMPTKAHEADAGQKIIQIVFLPIPDVELELTDSFCDSERGNNGFGSSGKF